jgi:hypothetical protein
MTRHADHAAKIIAAARVRRESGRRGGKDDHLADCRDGQAGNDQGTPSQPIPIVNREPRPTTAATQPVPRPNALPPNRSACRIAGSRTGGRPYRLVMHGSPPEGPRPVAARAGGHRRTGAGRRLFDHASGGGGTHRGRSRSRGPPARRRSDERRGGGSAQFVSTAAVGAAVKRGLQSPRDAPGLLPPGAARLRCPGERNGACRWLRPVRKSSDAPIRAVRMSRGRGRRGRQSRGTAGCRTR